MQSLLSGDKMLLYIIIWNMLSAVLIGFLNFPKLLLYITDAFNLLLFFNTIYTQYRKNRFSLNSATTWMIIFVFFGLLSAFANLTSPALMVWGIRQNLRYFIFFYACVEFLNEKTLNIILKIIEIVFWVSLPLCIYEALFVRYPVGTIIGDMVGGIFYGVGSANGPLNVILIIYSAHIMLKCFEGKVGFVRMLLTVSAAMYMAILAELKLFLVEILVIAIFVLITNKINWKTAALCLVGILAFNFIVTAFVAVNARGRAYYTEDLFSLQSMIEYATRSEGYDGVGDLNRFTAVQTLAKKFFSHDIMGLLFGYGLGSADYSKAIAAFTSPFYSHYSHLHYQYFSQAFVFIETGLVGLFSYFMIFFSSLKAGFTKLKKSKWKKFYLLIVLFMLFLIIYNTTMRNEFCAYILYAILAIPFAKNFNPVSSEKGELKE